MHSQTRPATTAGCFATHAAIALVGVQTEAQLQATIETRDLIGMAKTILMQRHDLDSASAFRLLVEASPNANVKLNEVAAWTVEHRRDRT
ncbi:ANTAR domain-containing protein [Amycolatopsis sp. NPDC004625]|uniref:ANTAR domain-containing protein n=1 Tax=Amycolatopsis sp. NPDC004625 TaxID=3154670 RepID=UPI0033BBEB11